MNSIAKRANWLVTLRLIFICLTSSKSQCVAYMQILDDFLYLQQDWRTWDIVRIVLSYRLNRKL